MILEKLNKKVNLKKIIWLSSSRLEIDKSARTFIWQWMEIETETHIGTLDLTP